MNAHSALLAQVRDAAVAPAPAPAPAARAVADDGSDSLGAVVSAAVLVAAAFRLRDEAGLIATLRLLTDAVVTMEARQAVADAEEEDGPAAAAA